MGWLFDLSALIVSLVAVGVSIAAYVRTRVPKPSWEFVGFEHDEEHEAEDDYGDAIRWSYRTVAVWAVSIRQNGPGAAESIRTQVMTPEGKWTNADAVVVDQITRGGMITVSAARGRRELGMYRVRVLYRCLPNTRRERSWEHQFELPPHPEEDDD